MEKVKRISQTTNNERS